MENNRNRNILGPKLFPQWLEAKGKLKFLNEFCKENKINTIQCHQIKEHLRDQIQNYKSIIRNAKHSYPNRKNYIINSGAIIYILEGKKYYHFGLITESKNLLHHKVRKRFCKSLITEYLQLQRINANEAKYFHNLSKSLFRIIFPDLLHLDETSHLTIIPDGDFHKLSFESLLLPESTDSNPVYLIEKIPISYSLGRQLSRNFDNLDNNKIASFSPSFDNTGVASRRSCANNSYSQLVCNSEEAASSAALLNGSHFDADKASVHNFLSSISNYDIIHIASHACIDTTDYLNSRLILNDGEVTVRDLYNVDFNGKTIILSACSTAEGRVMSGEGVFNLVRVMTELGCRDMIVSLWPIDDCETSKLLADYFSNLSKGIPPAVSLQQAKRNYLKNADKLRSQPFFWAPLIYISNDINTPSLSISFKKQERIKKVVTLCTGIGLGALTIGLFLKKRWGQAAA
jgi:CHAT domain-containing protein